MDLTGNLIKVLREQKMGWNVLRMRLVFGQLCFGICALAAVLWMAIVDRRAFVTGSAVDECYGDL